MLTAAIVIAVGLPAVWIDTRTHRIPNLLVGAALLAAIVVQFASAGGAGLLSGLGGAAVGLGMLLPLHLTGAMGAGDVKLMAAFGALAGPLTAALAVAFTLIAGSVMAMATLGWRRWATLVSPSPAPADRRTLAGRIPYAGAIVAGTLAATLVAP